MANSHIKTAYNYGVQQALQQHGYKTAAEVEQEAKELGILPEPEKTAEDNSLAALRRKLQG